VSRLRLASHPSLRRFGWRANPTAKAARRSLGEGGLIHAASLENPLWSREAEQDARRSPQANAEPPSGGSRYFAFTGRFA
jgi:hypothetical protein